MKLAVWTSFTMALQRKYLRGVIDEIHTRKSDEFLMMETQGGTLGRERSRRGQEDGISKGVGVSGFVTPSNGGCANAWSRIPAS
jgi:hypothetical protein